MHACMQWVCVWVCVRVHGCLRACAHVCGVCMMGTYWLIDDFTLRKLLHTNAGALGNQLVYYSLILHRYTCHIRTWTNLVPGFSSWLEHIHLPRALTRQEIQQVPVLRMTTSTCFKYINKPYFHSQVHSTHLKVKDINMSVLMTFIHVPITNDINNYLFQCYINIYSSEHPNYRK